MNTIFEHKESNIVYPNSKKYTSFQCWFDSEESKKNKNKKKRKII